MSDERATKTTPHRAAAANHNVVSSIVLNCFIFFFFISDKEELLSTMFKSFGGSVVVVVFAVKWLQEPPRFPPNLFLLQTPHAILSYPSHKICFVVIRELLGGSERESCNINKQDFSLPSNCCCLSQVRKFHSQMTGLCILSIEILCLHTFADWIPPEMES